MTKLIAILALALCLGPRLGAQVFPFGGEVWDHSNASIGINVQWIQLNSSNPGGTSQVQWGYGYGGCPVWVALDANQPHLDPRPYPDVLVHDGSPWHRGAQDRIERWLRKVYPSDRTVVLRLGYHGWNEDSPARPKQPVRVGKTSTAPDLAERLVPSVDVVDHGDGTLTAAFGYTGNWNHGITYPIFVRRNRLRSQGLISVDGQLPHIFAAGDHPAAFSITFEDTGRVRWYIDNKVVQADASIAVPAPTANN